MKSSIRIILIVLLAAIVVGKGIQLLYQSPTEVSASEMLEPITGAWVMEWNDRGTIRAETLYLVQHSSNKIFTAPSEDEKILNKVKFEMLPGLDARRITLRVSDNNYGPAYGYYYPLSKVLEYHYGNTLIHGTKDEDSEVKWKLSLPPKD